MEIRIYYECLEQALHYILPIVKNTARILKIQCDIKLIKTVKNANIFTLSKLHGIHRLTTPDFLITIVKNNTETPLIIGEFSEAVSTEDHELQREFGSVAACLSNIIFLKISGSKTTEKEHGGAYYNRYTTPKIYKEMMDYHGYIIAEWPTLKGNSALLQRNSEYISCPIPIPLVEATIFKSLEAYLLHSDSDDLTNMTIQLLSRQECYKEFLRKVEEAPNLAELEQNWIERQVSDDRRRFWVSNNNIKVKVYRLGHGMDPDRGILTFISFIETFVKKVWIIYNLEGIGKQGTIKTIQVVKTEFINKLKRDQMPKWLIEEMKGIVNNNSLLMDSKIDITKLWRKYNNEIENNKVLLTVVYFSDGMYLNRNGPLFTWNRMELLNCVRTKFVNTLYKKWRFDINVSPNKLQEVLNVLDEDEVTYTVVHRILRPNQFSIISVSYPGAQGSIVMLPESGKGRKQKRIYHDIIALPPYKFIHKIEPMIEESKGIFNQVEVLKAVNKLIKFKKSVSSKDILRDLLMKVSDSYKDSQILNIIIGIAFGTDTNTQTKWKPGNIDFIVRLENRKTWTIGIFNQNLLHYIPKITGETNLPTVYKILPYATSRQSEIFND